MAYTSNATGYIAQSLTKGEQLVYQGRISIPSLLPHLIFGGLLIMSSFGGDGSSESDNVGIIMLIIGGYLWAVAAIRYFTTELGITNKRVIAKSGLIRRNTIEINLQRIESIRVNQGIFGRMLNYGSIVVAGAGNPHAPIAGISDPMEFRKACIETQEKESSPTRN